MRKVKDESVEILNDIWAWKETIDCEGLSMLDIIAEYVERNELDPVEVGEMLASNKNFVKILENDLIDRKVFQVEEEPNSLDEWL